MVEPARRIFLEDGTPVTAANPFPVTDKSLGTVDSAAPTERVITAQVAESAVPTAVTDGDAVDQWHDLYGRQILFGSNLSEGTQDVSQTGPMPVGTTKVTGITQLTAPTNTAAINVSELSTYGYMFTLASVDTNVVVQLEGSIDGTNYATLQLENSAVAGSTITANQMTVTTDGTYSIYSKAPSNDVRFDFVSESGTTTATLDVDFFGRNV